MMLFAQLKFKKLSSLSVESSIDHEKNESPVKINNF